VTAAVISRDIFIIVGSAAIYIVTGFRNFRPSLPGKINTVIQICAIGAILIAAQFPFISGYLPTVYTTVFASALFSGLHYIFHASQIMNEEKQESEPVRTSNKSFTRRDLTLRATKRRILQSKVDIKGLRYYISAVFNPCLYI
jgi:hypothetical protein